MTGSLPMAKGSSRYLSLLRSSTNQSLLFYPSLQPLNTMTSSPSPIPTGSRSWANVVKNRSITLFEEEGYEEARRARQAESILARALNTNAVIFDFGTNIPSKAEAYRTLQQIGPVYGARTISRSRNPRSLLIEVRYEEDHHRDRAIEVGVTYDNVNYRATRALTLDAEITKVNFSSLPFLPQQAIRDGLEETMSLYGRVCQIRLYVEPETGIFEGEATVILDRSPPAGAMVSDDEPHYRPLTRFIPIDRWGELYPASWKNAPPICRYCNQEGHRKSSCPKLQDILCFHCNQPGHFRRQCPALRKKEKTLRFIDNASDTQLLDTYPIDQLDHRSSTSSRSSSVSDTDELPASQIDSTPPSIEDSTKIITSDISPALQPTADDSTNTDNTDNNDNGMITDDNPSMDYDHTMNTDNDIEFDTTHAPYVPSSKKQRTTTSSQRITRNMTQQKKQNSSGEHIASLQQQ